MANHTIFIALAAIGFLTSCNSKSPLASLRRSEITSITIGDCSSNQFSIADDTLIDQFWHAALSSKKTPIDNLKQNTGFARVWIYRQSNTEPLYLDITMSTVYGPVIDCHRVRSACDECGAFFTELKKTYPNFNWCQAPRIK
jgi:hypothetical protein